MARVHCAGAEKETGVDLLKAFDIRAVTVSVCTCDDMTVVIYVPLLSVVPFAAPKVVLPPEALRAMLAFDTALPCASLTVATRLMLDAPLAATILGLAVSVELAAVAGPAVNIMGAVLVMPAAVTRAFSLCAKVVR